MQPPRSSENIWIRLLAAEDASESNLQVSGMSSRCIPLGYITIVTSYPRDQSPETALLTHFANSLCEANHSDKQLIAKPARSFGPALYDFPRPCEGSGTWNIVCCRGVESFGERGIRRVTLATFSAPSAGLFELFASAQFSLQTLKIK